MSTKALQDYTFYSRYSQYIPSKKRRETWNEAVKRVFDMHRDKYAQQIANNPELKSEIDFAEKQVMKKRVLGAQRSLQFAGSSIQKHELKIYNCATTFIDRVEVFSEIMYALLCGVGVGFSVQKHHIAKLPPIHSRAGKDNYSFVVEDSIEGWADAVKACVMSFFDPDSKIPVFDFSKIRPEGALINNQFKAPGPEGLKRSLIKIEKVFERQIDEGKNVLRPIDAYDVVMHISDAVLSGGVRRSACLCQFSYDDEEMMNAKTGDWFIKNPQRARSNNSATLLKSTTTFEQFNKLMASTRQFGEPGFIWVDNLETVYNPCCEIAMIPSYEGESGWQGCNLTEINGKYCDNEEKFLMACRASAIIGTLQAGYTNFKYLKETSKKIFERESLLGCSITGIMDNPDILLNEEIQRKGAQEILKVNEKIAKWIGINPAARATCIKPAGSSSCLLGTASGIHPHHSRRYLRRVQSNRSEFCGQVFQKENPLAVEKSVWSANGTDNIITFICEVPAGAITKNQIPAIELLKKVKLTQSNWVEYGTRVERCVDPSLRHNVSNTITVNPDEWDEVSRFIYENRKYYAGISLLPSSGDLDYAQAPFVNVLSPMELVREYGDASVFASGLIVDGLHAFDNNLWAACDAVLGYGLELEDNKTPPQYPDSQDSKELAKYFEDKAAYDAWFNKKDWIRRVIQFGERYFNGDTRKATYCLKHVSIWKTWCDLSRTYKEIDWSNVVEERPELVSIDTTGATACNGNKCEYNF